MISKLIKKSIQEVGKYIRRALNFFPSLMEKIQYNKILKCNPDYKKL